MALTERKQVLGVGDLLSELDSQVDEPTPPISGSVHGKISDLTFAGTGSLAVPTNYVVPAITGTVQVGETLSASTGEWYDNGAEPTSYTYRWYADAVFLTGETAATYEVDEAVVGAVITVGTKAVNVAGTSAEAVSAATDAALPSLPTNSVAPAITGTEQEGETLTCSQGTWTDGGGTNAYTFQWLADDVEIDGETANTYVPVTADVGALLTCTVTATNEAGALSVTSAATGAIIAA